MSDCLKIKTLSGIDGNALPPMGAFRIHFTDGAVGYFQLVNKKYRNKCILIGDGTFLDSELNPIGKSIDTTSSTIYVSTGEFDVDVIDDDYRHTRLFLNNTNGRGAVNLSFMKYRPLTEIANFLSCPNIEGDIAFLADLSELSALRITGAKKVYGDIRHLTGSTKLTVLWLECPHIYGNISAISSITSLTEVNFKSTNVDGDISSLSALENVEILYLDSTDVIGDISVLENMHSLTTLTLNGAMGLYGNISALAKTNCNYAHLYGTQVTGSLEELVAALIANGRTSGTIRMRLPNTGITYNGMPINDYKNVSWTEDGTITF